MNQKFLPCVYRKEQCAAYHCGYCTALSDTRFKNRQCVFYKTKKQNAAETVACKERLRQLGAVELIEKYGG